MFLKGYDGCYGVLRYEKWFSRKFKKLIIKSGTLMGSIDEPGEYL